MVVEFTMLNQGETVRCAISTAAMDDLEGERGVKPDQRVDQFVRLRDTIEERASRKFFEGPVETRCFLGFTICRIDRQLLNRTSAAARAAFIRVCCSANPRVSAIFWTTAWTCGSIQTASQGLKIPPMLLALGDSYWTCVG
jgi:hypothetical protein